MFTWSPHREYWTLSLNETVLKREPVFRLMSLAGWRVLSYWQQVSCLTVECCVWDERANSKKPQNHRLSGRERKGTKSNMEILWSSWGFPAPSFEFSFWEHWAHQLSGPIAFQSAHLGSQGERRASRLLFSWRLERWRWIQTALDLVVARLIAQLGAFQLLSGSTITWLHSGFFISGLLVSLDQVQSECMPGRSLLNLRTLTSLSLGLITLSLDHDHWSSLGLWWIFCKFLVLHRQ